MITDCREPVGQEEPVILVTHGLGAIVAQKFVLAAVEKLHATDSVSNSRSDNLKLQKVLRNVRGLFYYSPYFAGSREINRVADAIRRPGPAVIYASELGVYSSRVVSEFQSLRSSSPYGENIKTMAVTEQNVTRTGGFKDQVVTEGTANIQVDKFVTVAADHIEVCQPKNTTNSYAFLETFIEEVLELSQTRIEPSS